MPILYWVKPFLKEAIRGPNPMLKVSTPIPQALPTRKWPSSWTKIKMPRNKIMATTGEVSSADNGVTSETSITIEK